MWEEPRWKVPWMYIWGGIYRQGWNCPLWLFDFPHDCLTLMNFQIKWLFRLRVGLLEFHFTLDSLTIVWPTVVMWLTWIMTQLDMTMMVCSCCYSCACQAAVLLSDGCLLRVSQLCLCMERCVESSMVKMCVEFSMVIGLLDVACAHCSFVCTLACLTCLSVCEIMSLHTCNTRCFNLC